MMDDFDRTALIYASGNKYLHIMRLLIAYGADVTHTDIDGNSSLEYAIEAQDYQECELLIAHGAHRPHIAPRSRISPEIKNLLQEPLPLHRICALHVWCQFAL